MGAVVPAVEDSPILACSFSSQKYPHRAPEGKVLLRVFVGGARRPELAEMPDQELRPLVIGHVTALLGIEGEPIFCDVAHWPRTMPQYHVDHKQLVAGIEARAAALPHLELAGNAYHGVGVPDCIHGGELAAERLLASFAAAGSRVLHERVWWLFAVRRARFSATRLNWGTRSSDQKMNRLDEVHEEVFPICLDRAILPPRSLNIKGRNSLTANENGVVGMDRLAMVRGAVI